MSSQAEPRVLFGRQERAATVSRLAAEISRDYQSKCPILMGILKGSFIFMADLVRLLDFPLVVDFIRVSSYGRGRESSGEIKVVPGLRSQVRNRDVLVIEDIVDTGLTIAFLLDYLRKKKLEQAAAHLGTKLPSPFSTLSFVALPVIPELRLTDLGLVDVGQFRLIKRGE